MPDLNLTGEPEADALLSDSPLALMIGMLLDQQIPMERAFAGPRKLADRLDGELTAERIADADPEELEELFSETPAIHRFPSMMAGRVQSLCAHLVEHYGGDAAAVWESAGDAEQLAARLRDLPGFGEQKSRVFLALLAKQLGVRPDGWEEQAGDYAEDGYRSIADVTDPDALRRVREFKRAQKSG